MPNNMWHMNAMSC